MDLLLDPEVNRRGWKLADREIVLPKWDRRGFEEEFIKISRILKNVRDWQVVVYEQILKKMEGSDFCSMFCKIN